METSFQGRGRNSPTPGAANVYDLLEVPHSTTPPPPLGARYAAREEPSSIGTLLVSQPLSSRAPLSSSTVSSQEAGAASGSTGRVSSKTLDGIGMGLSAVCAFKCMGVPVLASALSIGGLTAIAHHPAVVWSVAGLALPVAAWRLIGREIKRGRFITPLAATVASGAVTIGAIGHSLPPSDAAPLVSAGGCCAPAVSPVSSAPENSHSASHTASHTMPHAKPHSLPDSASFGQVDLPLYEKMRANAHSSLLLGAMALGLLHLNVMARDIVTRRRKGPCGKESTECACEPGSVDSSSSRDGSGKTVSGEN
jgi:hypothetical protein